MDTKLFKKLFFKIVGTALIVFIVASLIMIGKGLITGGDVNVLVLATDKGELLTDTIMIANVNTHTKNINLLSLPRDTRVTLRNQSHGKLNSVYGSAPEGERVNEVKKKVRELTGLDVDYYVVIHPDGFRHVIDALGGVDFNVPQDMDYEDPSQDLYIHLKAGMQHLDGEAAEGYTRFRSGYATADLGRIEAQQEFLKELYHQKMNLGTMLRVPTLYARLKSDFDTDIGLSDAVRIAKTIKPIGVDNINTYTLPSSPQYIGGASYVIYNEAETKNLIESVFLAR